MPLHDIYYKLTIVSVSQCKRNSFHTMHQLSQLALKELKKVDNAVPMKSKYGKRTTSCRRVNLVYTVRWQACNITCKLSTPVVQLGSVPKTTGCF